MNLNERLIEEIKKFPFLYNKKEKDYKNTQKKVKTWHTIAEKLNLTDEECSTKWKSLRDRFTRELKRNAAITITGSESQQLEQPEWEFYQTMFFLKEHCEPNKKTKSNFKQIRKNNNSPSADTETDNTIELMTSSSELLTSSSSSHQRCEETPRRKLANKRLDDVNKSFKEAAEAFKEICSKQKKNKNSR